MSRVQLALNVDDLDSAITFYSKLFATEPARESAVGHEMTGSSAPVSSPARTGQRHSDPVIGAHVPRECRTPSSRHSPQPFQSTPPTPTHLNAKPPCPRFNEKDTHLPQIQ
jgi:hypothetical protein